MFDKLHEECGVFGIFGHPDAVKLDISRTLLPPAQRPRISWDRVHRREPTLREKDMGHVADIFTEERIKNFLVIWLSDIIAIRLTGEALP